MQLVRKFRLPALFCAFAVLVCELLSRPYAEMGISDDGPYILIAQKLAATGHIAYGGMAAAMLVWQLYLGAAFIKLFGFFFTTARMSTLLVAMVLAFFLQRIMVRANISERNATIGTLTLVLSPLYMMLSVTFMSDVHGLFAIVLCLYGCLRALKASTSRAAIIWLCFAVVTNAICGTSRQIAWLGILVMVPSCLWLLRAQRRVLIAGAVATFAGVLFIFGCMYWFSHQPYIQPEHLLLSTFPIARILSQFIHFFLDFPFLLLPIAALFLPEIRRVRPLVIAIISVLFLGFLFVAFYPSHLRGDFSTLLEPALGDWVTASGGYGHLAKGDAPIFLDAGVRVLLTVVSFGGLFGLIVSFFRSRGIPPAVGPFTGVSWKQLGVLLAPFSIVYTMLLIVRAVTWYGLFDRYTLGLLVVALICSVRFYQDRIQPRLPTASVLLVASMAIYSIAATHNMFAFYRARLAIDAELRASGVPDTSVDNGWEYNSVVELQHADYVNTPETEALGHAHVPTPPLPVGTCPMLGYEVFPHIKPRYGISYDPNACYGPAPFAPVSYSRWLTSRPGILYVVNYTGSSQP